MFEQDYLMRQILQLVQAIRLVLDGPNPDKVDPKAQADTLEAAIGAATELDGATLLSLSPESIASILQVSGTDPAVVEYVSRSLFLESSYLSRAGNEQLATLRLQQARALADSYGFTLHEDIGPEDAMRAFLESQQEDA